ncbi:hypothetical protein [Chryseobacterium indoltheticum]|uniref:hypothetical protein n=1 Tax=Chryseobacterium indoltheticum TaxID=254 RepID=UPI0019136607|nr:hypothetical protein [Chryseobacterium indoltheticum]QQQ29106.1 hypothetical protein JJL46_03595 [Chryseobacterium indoltheticum]
MKVESFLEIVEEIEHSCLSAERQEEMITKVADLSRFIQSYDPSIEIVSWMRYRVSIIRHSGASKGVIFCDHKDLFSASTYYSNANLAALKKLDQLEEVWLVVISSCGADSPRPLKNLPADQSLDKIYDKIFSLDFLQSEVQIIK